MIQIINPVTGGASDPSQITSETAPTTRADGSPLQVGDRWHKPSTGEEGFWNGTLWLTINQFNLSGAVSTAAVSGGFNNYVLAQNSLGGSQIFNGLFVRNLRIKYRANGAITLQDASNYRRIVLTVRGVSNVIRTFNFDVIYLLNGVQYPFATSSYQFIDIPINTFVPENDIGVVSAASGIVGSPNFAMDSAFSFDIRGVMA